MLVLSRHRDEIICIGDDILVTDADRVRKAAAAGVCVDYHSFAQRYTDIATIAAHYKGRQGKHPELASPIRWLA